MLDVVALGELLIDFTSSGFSERGSELFEKNPGGAPANVLVSVSKLGKRTSFIGKTGNDCFGAFLRDALLAEGVDTEGMVFSDSVNTTLAFVHLNKKGDRSFSFYRNPGADMMLTEEEIRFELIDKARIFHFGSVSMTNEPARNATLKAAEYAKGAGILVSYDPNLRMQLWKNSDEARAAIEGGLKYADLLKISEGEMLFLTGEADPDKGFDYLLRKYGISLILVTLGKKGSFYRLEGHTGHAFAYNVKTIDTTGAGDDRLVGAAKLCKKNGINPVYVSLGIASGLKFASQSGESVNAIQKNISVNEIEGTIKKICSIRASDSIFTQIVNFYEIISQEVTIDNIVTFAEQIKSNELK